MSRKKRRGGPPQMLLWDRKQQARFITAVEQIVATARQLEALTSELHTYVLTLQRRDEAAQQRRSAAAAKANATRSAPPS